VTITGDRAGVGGGTQRPNVVGEAARLAQIGEYFDVTAFALPVLGTFGDAGVSTVRGPGISNEFTMNFYRNSCQLPNGPVRAPRALAILAVIELHGQRGAVER
jgi:hypothetical protein